MKPTYNFKPQSNGTNFGKFTLTLAAGITLGYGVRHITDFNEGYKVRDGMIEYKGEVSRPISNKNGVIQVGTTKERVNDLLYENPAVIKKTVEELYSTYMSE